MLSGFYPVFLVVVIALVLRGVAFEFRSHAETDRSRRMWGGALIAGSLVIPLGLGIVLGGLLGGVPIDAKQEFTGDLGDLLAPYAIATGVTLTVLCLVHGATYLSLRTAEAALHARARRAARVLGPVAALVVLGFCIWTRVVARGGFLLSFIEFAAVLAAIGAAALVRGGRSGAAFAATSVTMAAVVASIFSELYPRVMVSSLGSANDLTAQNTASASYALTVMTVVLAVVLPVVLLYQAWTFHVFRGRVGGPKVDAGDPAPVLPVPRRAPAPAGAPVGSGPERPAAGSVAPASRPGPGEGVARRGRTDGTASGRGLLAAGFAVLLTWPVLRQLMVHRARPR
jgi:cytochrome d ubiquinol oxidase subunit II